jgi:hypothetical protein
MKRLMAMIVGLMLAAANHAHAGTIMAGFA